MQPRRDAAGEEDSRRRQAKLLGIKAVPDLESLLAMGVDVVDICTPNNVHAEIAIAAARAGKMVLSEKPLARTEAEGLPMVEAVEKAGVANMVWYNYRRVPAVMLIRNLVASGKLEQHRVIHTDWAARRTLYKTLGFIFVGIGLLLLGLMIYALLSRLGH